MRIRLALIGVDDFDIAVIIETVHYERLHQPSKTFHL